MCVAHQCGACAGHADIVRTLLEKGASVEAKDASGETPLHLAVSMGERLIDRCSCPASHRHHRQAVPSALLNCCAPALMRGHTRMRKANRRTRRHKSLRRAAPMASWCCRPLGEDRVYVYACGVVCCGPLIACAALSDVYDMGGSDKADPNKPPRWVPDDSVTECSACKEAFTVMRRYDVPRSQSTVV